jgi:hypothetical protein
VNNPIQRVGEKATFLIIGAPPGAPIYWSSYKNGVATGELNADYGHRTESNGTAQIEMSSPWTAEQTGDWIKEILIQDSTGNNYTAMVVYRVVPAPQLLPLRFSDRWRAAWWVVSRRGDRDPKLATPGGGRGCPGGSQIIMRQIRSQSGLGFLYVPPDTGGWDLV